MDPLTNDPMAPQSSVMRAEPDTVSDGRKAVVASWVKRVQEAEKHWEPKFAQMRRDTDFARGMQWPGVTKPEDDDRYVANIVQRHIGQRVAALYAKNPRFVSRRRQTLDFRVWDEKPDSLAMAQDTMMLAEQAAMGIEAGVPPPPGLLEEAQRAAAVLADVQEAQQRRAMLDKVGKTLEVLFRHQVAEQQPPFKKQAKQLVRRTLATSVGYIKLGFERIMEPRPEDADGIRDITLQLSDIEQRMAELGDDEPHGDLDTRREELQTRLSVLQSNPQQIVREGLVFDFPPPTTIIPDPRCRQLQGFVGAGWVAQKFLLAPTEIERVYGIDVRGVGFTAYNRDGAAGEARKHDYSGMSRSADANEDGKPDQAGLVCVYEIQDKHARHVFTVADGCPVYLREPGSPDVTLDRFWTLFALTFNDIEHEKEIFPPSDVELLRHMQLEHNRSREALREHRKAAAPGYAAPRGALSDEDKELLAGHMPHSTVELDGLSPTQKVGDILQPLPKHGIDPNLYETNTIFDDILKVAGVQEAQVGGTSGATATETSIAEGARMASVASNVDDLDDFFNELAQAASQIMLAEFDGETVTKLCGPGAGWPQLSGQDIADSLLLEVEAGSSGKPNRAADIKNFMDMAPILMQVPGIRPDWLAREGIKRLDDRLDLTDAFLEGLPSIQSLNKVAQVNAGPPGKDPNAQGDKGGDNAPGAKGGNPQPNQGQAAGASRNPGQGLNPMG
jgi:hypothetical protein